MDAPKTRDRWEKVDILLKGLLPVAVASVGYFGTSYLSDRQREESTTQFYTGLQAQREQADSNLRKEMFRYVIESFLGNPQGNTTKMVTGLEMLALNFHDSFDLSPLFKQTFKVVQHEEPDAELSRQLVDRLVGISQEITDRQIAALADEKHRWDAEISDFQETRAENFGSKLLLERNLAPLPESGKPAPGPPAGNSAVALNLRLDVLAVDTATRSLQLRLEVRRPDSVQPVVERAFWLSYFDFPSLNNVRLPNRERLAVALLRFDTNSAQLQVLHFPESRASLKEKPYFDDLVKDVRRQSGH